MHWLLTLSPGAERPGWATEEVKKATVWVNPRSETPQKWRMSCSPSSRSVLRNPTAGESEAGRLPRSEHKIRQGKAMGTPSLLRSCWGSGNLGLIGVGVRKPGLAGGGGQECLGGLGRTPDWERDSCSWGMLSK